MTADLFAAPPLLTADLPGLGGRIKAQPEDFEVEEMPAYEPSGQGDHLFLWIEKRGMGAEFFARQIAKRLDVPLGSVGTAGLKDRHAVTRQWVSVPGDVEQRVAQLESDDLHILKVSRHGNKLRAGHLHGNRFTILIRDARLDVPLDPILDRLQSLGLPNFFGPQRFGHDQETLKAGLAMLRGEPPPPSVSGKPINLRSPFLRKLALSAAQAGLFNCYLARRMADGLMRTVLPGDVMAKWPFGGMFVAENVAAEQSRFDARATVAAGPIFGKKTFPSRELAADRENALLAEVALPKDAFRRFGKLLLGTRRHNLIYVENLTANRESEGVRLSFALPAGSYATVLLREVMKSPFDNVEENTEVP